MNAFEQPTILKYMRLSWKVESAPPQCAHVVAGPSQYKLDVRLWLNQARAQTKHLK